MLSFMVITLCFVVLGVVAVGGVRAANPVVVMETNMGTIKIELCEDKAPVTVKNFLDYVKDKHYDGTIFHRVMGNPHAQDDFIIPGSDLEPTMKQTKTEQKIREEYRERRSSRKDGADNGPTETRRQV